MKTRLNFLEIMLIVFIALIVLALLRPAYAPPGKLMAAIHAARSEEAKITFALKQRATEIGGLTNIGGGFIHDEIFGTNSYILSRTNAQGEILDFWKTPYQIEVVARSNFIIRSAGPNRKFGDKDDIISHSASNGFLKP